MLRPQHAGRDKKDYAGPQGKSKRTPEAPWTPATTPLAAGHGADHPPPAAGIVGTLGPQVATAPDFPIVSAHPALPNSRMSTLADDLGNRSRSPADAKISLALCVIGILAVATTGCIDHEGQLAIFLTRDDADDQQATITAQQVRVEIVQVDVFDNQDGEFLTLFRGSTQQELLGLQGRTALLALGEALEEGNYSRIRLTFSDADSSVVNSSGRVDPLKVEPPQVEVPVLLSVVEDASTEVTLDIDVESSLTLKANGTWVLRPVITQSTR